MDQLCTVYTHHPVGLQAILLLIWYSLLNPEKGSIWYLVGLATRTCVDMGYHNEHNLNVQIDKLDALELDMRRRLFYCTYKMDRLLSQALGRPVSIPDGFINVPVSFYSSLTRNISTRDTVLISSYRPLSMMSISGRGTTDLYPREKHAHTRRSFCTRSDCVSCSLRSSTIHSVYTMAAPNRARIGQMSVMIG